MGRRLDTVLNVLLATAAITMAAVVARRELFVDATGAAASIDPSTPPPPEFLSGWAPLLKQGHTIGPPSASVQLIEFIDLECPACRRFHSGALREIRADFPSQVSVTYLHLPLTTIHRFAEVSAHAAECAGEQGQFGPFIDLVYEKQDSIGLKSWSDFAAEAGVSDAVAFGGCLALPTAPAIALQSAIADSLGIRATPTVIVNGWRLGRPPGTGNLRHLVRELIAGRDPFSGGPR